MTLTRRDIELLDPRLFSPEDKRAAIELLYGKREEWTWKRDLEKAAKDLSRWRRLIEQGDERGQPYKVALSTLRRLARGRPPADFSPSVTAFTDLIFRLYCLERDAYPLRRGRAVEAAIARRHLPVPSHGSRKLIYDGRAESTAEPLRISALEINGQHLRGKPDVVFRHKGTGEVLILELKASRATVPLDGWPNLRAQLWAYSLIDEFRDAPALTLAAEVWGFSLPHLTLKRTLRWSANDEGLSTEGRELFTIYRSHHEQGTAKSGCGN